MTKTNIKFLIFILLITSTACLTLKQNTISYTEKINNLKINMIKVEGGTFIMGCNKKERDCTIDELPLHKVVLNDFFISRFEITYKQYDLFCKATGRKKVKDFGWGRGKRPIVGVSWYDAEEFCKWLSKISGKTYRLPTEAEWEYAAKGGNKSKGFRYAGSNDIYKVAWFSPYNHQRNDSLKYMKTQRVGRKKPNEIGLYDMSGNVWEWCYDNYSKYFYKHSPKENPISTKGRLKVARGGGWESTVDYAIITNRDYDFPEKKDSDLGFRIVREINSEK